MNNWITEIMEQYGYVGIFVMMCLENLFPPIPSEVILPFGGFMTTTSSLEWYAVIIVATTGSLTGALALYMVGILVGREKIEGFVLRWGHILRIQSSDLARADAWFERYGYWTVFLCRMVPLLRSLISIPAGMWKMNVTQFVLLTTIGSLIWNTTLILMGVWLGRSWTHVLDFMELYSTFLYALVAIGALYVSVRWMQRYRRSWK
ncbi:DedA family protein [Halobacillus locisalis]|uniref:DedA family protein n=2 Tax=Halobacillus locisalis TaxID=220753 RepID=A0A838CUD7_9BACI|nr:DedA family protein [Halobacillus locisalis]MBA2175419.1 DedA family protein [Halobacillus locisalis]